MKRFDFYKNAYDMEIDRRKSINADLTFPIGIVTALIGWLFYFHTQPFLQQNLSFWLTNLLFFLCLATLLLSILFICWSYFAFTITLSKNGIKKYFLYQYDYLENINEYERFYNERVIANNESKLRGTPISDQELEENVIIDLISCTNHNITINDKKVGSFSIAKGLLIINLVFNFLLLSSTLLFPNVPKTKIPTTFTQITSPVKVVIVDTIKSAFAKPRKN